MYIGKERRVSTIADRRVKTPMARLGGTRAGLDNNYRDDMPYVVIGADRRSHRSNTMAYMNPPLNTGADDCGTPFPTECYNSRLGDEHAEYPITPTVVEHTPGKTTQEKFDRAKSYNSGNSALLIEYREALIRAYELGKDIKELYGIVPPKAIIDWDGPTVTIGLQVN